jgi:hypothetical protein
LLSLDDLRADLALANNAGSASGPQKVDNTLTKNMVNFVTLHDFTKLPDAFFIGAMEKVYAAIQPVSTNGFPLSNVANFLQIKEYLLSHFFKSDSLFDLMKEAISTNGGPGLVACFHRGNLFASGMQTEQYIVNSMRDSIRIQGVLRDTFTHSSAVLDPYGPVNRLQGGTFGVESHEQVQMSCYSPPGHVLHMYISGVPMVAEYQSAASTFANNLIVRIFQRCNALFQTVQDAITAAGDGADLSVVMDTVVAAEPDFQQTLFASVANSYKSEDGEHTDPDFLEQMRRVLQGQMLRPSVSVSASHSHNQMKGLPVDGKEAFAAINLGLVSMETSDRKPTETLLHAVDGKRAPADMTRHGLYPIVVYCT